MVSQYGINTQNNSISSSSDSNVFISLIIIISIALVIAIIIIIVKQIKRKQTNFVVDTSDKLQKILALNDLYHFFDIPNPLTFTRKCKSKKEFDRLDLTDFLVRCISEYPEYYKQLLDEADENDRSFKEYKEQFMLIIQSNSEEEQQRYDKYWYYQEMEEDICYQRMLSPVLQISAHIDKSYISPQGRSQYYDHADFTHADIIDSLKKSKRVSIHRERVYYERSLMTDSLRYDVLKRDNFRCTICGATAQDGVKLHIDHIFPVSKGGKTELNNLRTLCERCNRGKAAKYDYEGKN